MNNQLLALLLGAALLAGCSGPKRIDYQSDAERARALEVPPDLVLPKTDDRYAIPEGSAAEASASYSDYARSIAAQSQACICKDAAASAAAPQPAQPVPVAAPPKLQDKADGSKSILLGEPFDRCWLTVSQALDRAKLAVEDKDRNNGLLYLKGGHNQIEVHAIASGCEVAANNGSGAASDETRRIIEALYKNLTK